MNTVYLHGGLGKRFGKKWLVAASDCYDVIRAVDSNVDGFIGYLIKQSLEGNEHFLLAKNPTKIKSKKELRENLIKPEQNSKEIHIVPQIYGGVVMTALTKIGLGVTAAKIGSAAIWGIGATLAMNKLNKPPSGAGGAPSSSSVSRDGSAQTKSLMLEASRETASNGSTVPLGYGTMLCGPLLISQKMRTRWSAKRYKDKALVTDSGKLVPMPTNLLESEANVSLQHLICEGPIEGPVTPKGVLIDDKGFEAQNYGDRIIVFSGSSSLKSEKNILSGLYINEVPVLDNGQYNYQLNSLGNNESNVSFVNGSYSKHQSFGWKNPATIYTYSQQLIGGQPSKTVEAKMPNADLSDRPFFHHVVSSLNCKQLLITFRTSLFETSQKDGKNYPTQIYFAIFIQDEYGERNIFSDDNIKLDGFPDFNFRKSLLVGNYWPLMSYGLGSGAGVSVDNWAANPGSTINDELKYRHKSKFKVYGISTGDYQFQIRLIFKKKYSSKAPKIKIVKLSNELDNSVASNVYTQWTTYNKRQVGSKKKFLFVTTSDTRRTVYDPVLHEKTTRNESGGQGKLQRLSVDNVQEFYDGRFMYPGYALSSINIDSRNFGSQPTIAWHLKLKKVLVPSNYRASDRKYDGPWNGLFAGQSSASESIHSVDEKNKVWTDNPAWIFYDMISNQRYGCGRYGIQESDIDKWQLYKVAKYCDELVETDYPIQTQNGMLYSFKFEGRQSVSVGDKFNKEQTITIDRRKYSFDGNGDLTYTPELSNAEFEKDFGNDTSFRGKSIILYIHDHPYGDQLNDYGTTIRKKSVLKQNCNLLRLRIISSNKSSKTVVVVGENLENHKSTYRNASVLGSGNIGNTYLFGACVVEKDHPIAEPRFTANFYLKDSMLALDLLNMFSNFFRGVMCYTSGKISLTQDRKIYPIQLFNNTNVSKEGFRYSGTDKKARFNTIRLAFNNKDNNYKIEYIYEEDIESIQKIGIVENEINALSITSVSEARRFAKWALINAQYEQEAVNFITGQEGSFTFPGSIIEVYDEMRAGNFRSGRILDIQTNSKQTYFTIDKSVLKEPIVGTIEFTASAGLDYVTYEQIENRAENEKSEVDQDFEIDSTRSQQLIKFQARIVPDPEDESKSRVVDMLVKLVFELDRESDTLKAFYHGLKDGDRVRFASDGKLPVGLSPFEEYYISNATDHTFQISRTIVGDPIKIIDEGKDRLLNKGGEHFVVPVDQDKTQERIDQIMIGAVYSIRGDIGVIEDNKKDITSEELSKLGISSDLSEDWATSSIFGQVKIVDKNWLYAKNLGWIYIRDLIETPQDSINSNEYFWFYVGSFGWVGTTNLIKNSIWFIPSLKQNTFGATGFVNITYNSDSVASNLFVYLENASYIDEYQTYIHVGSGNRKLGRPCDIIRTISDSNVSGYFLDISDDDFINENYNSFQNNNTDSIEKYHVLDIESGETSYTDGSLIAVSSLFLNLDYNFEFDINKNYNIVIEGVTSTTQDTTIINKTWTFLFINENTIELVNSDFWTDWENGVSELDFSNAKAYFLKEFDSDYKKFNQGKYYKVMNNKEIGQGKYEIIATEYAFEKFDAIDKKGVIRKPVIPIPPQEGMIAPEGPTNLVLNSSTT